MKRFWTTLLLLLPLVGFAQNKKSFTIEELTPGAREYWALTPSIPDDINNLPAPLEMKNGRITFKRSEKSYHEKIADFPSAPKQWTEKILSPNEEYLILLDGKDIALMDKEGNIKSVTSDGCLDIVNGQAAHQREFGISGGIFLSPSGKKFAYYRMDQSMVESYPIVRTTKNNAIHDPIKYPMAGKRSHEVTVNIYDVESASIVTLKTGEPLDRFFTNIAWTPDEKSLFIDEVNRAQNRCELREYSVNDGALINTLIVEENDKYIEPQTPTYFLKDSSNRFIRVTRRDGYNHLYLYGRDGKLQKQLTKGEWEVLDFMGTDPDSKYAYFISNKDYIMGRDLYRVALKNGKLERLTTGDGTHRIQMSEGFDYAFDTFTNHDTPQVGTLITLGKKVGRQEIYRSADPLKDFVKPEVRLGTLKSPEGYDLYYKMTLPPDLDETKKYPVVLYVYGGPHAQLVTDTWNGLRMGWDTYMAQEGYIVFTIDNRGSANRGMAFESVTHRQLGTVEMEDQMIGIDYLRSLPYIDSDRIGVYGWSFGGFMTTNLMLTHSDTFKVGVAGGPVMDWGYYEIMYGERYMDTPQENPEGYAKNRLTDRAGDLKGRLLLIHGSVDPVVVLQHSFRFLEASVKAGTLPDYMIYPNEEHNVRGQDRVHLHRVICRYFDDHLK